MSELSSRTMQSIMYTSLVQNAVHWTEESHLADYATALIALAGLWFVWRDWRQRTLRQTEILEWANRVISSLESLLIVTTHYNHLPNRQMSDDKIDTIMFETAIETERGRIFFRNQVTDEYGKEKEKAYRGYRPRILDPIVTAHQVALRWHSASPQTRLALAVVAEDCLKRFVSLAQMEVGRSKSASAEPSKGGAGARLDAMLAAVSPQRLSQLEKRGIGPAPESDEGSPVRRSAT